MVVFVDYEQNSYDDVHRQFSEALLQPFTDKGGLHLMKPIDRRDYTDYATPLSKANEDENSRLSRDAINLNAFSRCLACYPYDALLATKSLPSLLKLTFH